MMSIPGGALAYALRLLGIHCELCCCDKISERYLPITNKFINEVRENAVGIAIDSQNPERLGRYSSASISFCLDHHENNGFNVDFCYVDETKSSCCEIIFELIKNMQVEMTKEIADALYMGIITDTLCFRTRTTNASTIRTAAEIAEYGADIVNIARTYCFEKTPQRMEIEKILCNSFYYLCDGKVLFATVTYEDLKKNGIDDLELEGLNQVVDQVSGVEIGIVIREVKPSKCRVSVRTNDKYNAYLICSKFGGGGHVDRAGCEIEKSPLETRTMLEEACVDFLTEKE